MSKFVIFIQFHVVIIFSVPWSRKIISGIRLMKNAVLTAVLAYLVVQSWLRGFGFSVTMRGQTRITKVKIRVVVMIIMSCYLELHQEFLVPKTNGWTIIL